MEFLLFFRLLRCCRAQFWLLLFTAVFSFKDQIRVLKVFGNLRVMGGAPLPVQEDTMLRLHTLCTWTNVWSPHNFVCMPHSGAW